MHFKLQGRITFEKLKQVARSVGEKLTDEELQEMISEADIDGNTSLSFWENKYMSILNYDFNNSKIVERLFSAFTVGDGQLNRDEFVDLMKSIQFWTIMSLLKKTIHDVSMFVPRPFLMIIILFLIHKEVILVNSKYFVNLMGMACIVF